MSVEKRGSEGYDKPEGREVEGIRLMARYAKGERREGWKEWGYMEKREKE